MFGLVFSWIRSNLFGGLGKYILLAIVAVVISFFINHWLESKEKLEISLEKATVEKQQLQQANQQLGQSVVILDKVNVELDKTLNQQAEFNQQRENAVTEIIATKQDHIEKTKIAYANHSESKSQQELDYAVSKIQITAVWTAYCQASQQPNCITAKDPQP